MKNIFTKLPFVIFILSFGFFIGMIARWGSYYAGGAWWRPVISCDAPVHDLGIISSDETVPAFPFIIRNSGGCDLKIESVTPSCGGCLKVVDYTNTPISSQKSGVVSIQILPKELNGPFERGVVVRSNATNQPILLLRLKAEIVGVKR